MTSAPVSMWPMLQGDEVGAEGSDLIQLMVRCNQRINACATRNCGQSYVKPSPSAERMGGMLLVSTSAAHRSRRRARDFKHGASCVTNDTAHLLFPAAGCLWYNCISNHG